MHLLKISWLAVLRLTSADVATGHSMGYLESQKFLGIRDDKSFGFAMEFLLIQFVKMPILHPRVISMIILVILFMARWLRTVGCLTWSTSPAEVATALSGWPLFGLLAQVSLRKVGHSGVYPKWCIQLWSHEDWVYKLMIGPFSVATCSEFGGSVRIQHVIPPNSTAKVILEGSFARGNRGSWELLGMSVLFKGSKGFIDRYTYHLLYLF